MNRVWKTLLLLLISLSLVAAVVVSVGADPIHVPGGPRFDGGGAIILLVDYPVVLGDSVFTPIHVPGGP